MGCLLMVVCLAFLFAEHLAGPQKVSTVFAAEQTRATVRIGRHPDFNRIVFSVADDYVQKASVTRLDKEGIRVEFPAAVVIAHPDKRVLKDEVSLEVSEGIRLFIKGTACRLTVQNLNDFKVSKLSSPPRLVIDAYIRKPSQSAVEEKAQNPPASSSREELAVVLKSLVIDAGHGGYDRGIRAEGFTEKDSALSFAKDLASALAKKGKKVYLTRKSDQVLSLQERIKIIQQRVPDIVISIHLSPFNQLSLFTAPQNVTKADQDSRGGDGGKAPADISAAIANAVAQNVRKALDVAVNREDLPLSLLVHGTVPGILMELPNPGTFSYDKNSKEKLLNAVVKGILSPSAVP